MSNNKETRLEEQLSDALYTLGIEDDYKVIDAEKTLVAHLWYFSGENVCVAKALLDVSDKIHVILTRFYGSSLVELREGKVIPVKVEWIPCFIFSENWVPVWSSKDHFWCGNAVGFKKYSENKRLAWMILRQSGIAVPKEIEFRGIRLKKELEAIDNEGTEGSDYELYRDFYIKWAKQDNATIQEFWNELWHDKRIVIKPLDWKCWGGIEMYSYKEFTATYGDSDIPHDFSEHTKTLLVQEKIESYPIHIDCRRKDWNVRVLVTYDYERQQYITAGIVWRIDDDGGPVNRSISADYISLEEIGKLANWSKEEYIQVKKDIEQTAEKSVHAIVGRGRKNNTFKKVHEGLDFQTISGVDIIVDAHKKPYVIEVNDSNSGCLYELTKLQGVSSLHPVAQSIKEKTEQNFALKTFFKLMRKNWWADALRNL